MLNGNLNSSDSKVKYNEAIIDLCEANPGYVKVLDGNLCSNSGEVMFLGNQRIALQDNCDPCALADGINVQNSDYRAICGEPSGETVNCVIPGGGQATGDTAFGDVVDIITGTNVVLTSPNLGVVVGATGPRGATGATGAAGTNTDPTTNPDIDVGGLVGQKDDIVFSTNTIAFGDLSLVGPATALKASTQANGTILAIRDQVAPPTINLDNPARETPVDLAPNQKVSREINFAISNSFGFGGTNASLLLAKV